MMRVVVCVEKTETRGPPAPNGSSPAAIRSVRDPIERNARSPTFADVSVRVRRRIGESPSNALSIGTLFRARVLAAAPFAVLTRVVPGVVPRHEQVRQLVHVRFRVRALVIARRAGVQRRGRRRTRPPPDVAAERRRRGRARSAHVVMVARGVRVERAAGTGRTGRTAVPPRRRRRRMAEPARERRRARRTGSRTGMMTRVTTWIVMDRRRPRVVAVIWVVVLALRRAVRVGGVVRVVGVPGRRLAAGGRPGIGRGRRGVPGEGRPARRRRRGGGRGRSRGCSRDAPARGRRGRGVPGPAHRRRERRPRRPRRRSRAESVRDLIPLHRAVVRIHQGAVVPGVLAAQPILAGGDVRVPIALQTAARRVHRGCGLGRCLRADTRCGLATKTSGTFDIARRDSRTRRGTRVVFH